MNTISTAELVGGISDRVVRDVKASLRELILSLYEKERWVTRKEYGEYYGIGNTKLQGMEDYLREHKALVDVHKAQRYDKLFNPHTRENILG